MNQIRLSKHLYSQKYRFIFSSKLNLSATSPNVNITTNSSANPESNLKKTNKVDILMNVQKQEEESIHNILQSFTPSQLLQVLKVAAILHPFILHTILSILDYNPALRPKTTSESVHKFFSKYGENEEAKALFDKAPRKSKGGCFLTFKKGAGGGPGGQFGAGFEEKSSSTLGPAP